MKQTAGRQKNMNHKLDIFVHSTLRRWMQGSGYFPGRRSRTAFTDAVQILKSVYTYGDPTMTVPENCCRLYILLIKKRFPAYKSGAGLRGGNWNNDATNMCVSNRNNAANTNTNRNNNNGARVLRGLPASVGGIG